MKNLSISNYGEVHFDELKNSTYICVNTDTTNVFISTKDGLFEVDIKSRKASFIYFQDFQDFIIKT